MKRLLTSIVLAILIDTTTASTLWETLAVSVSLYALLTFIDRIGTSIAILDCIAFVAALEILLIPAVTYWLLPLTMPVSSDVYFGYAVPAYAAFFTGLHFFSWPLPGQTHQDVIWAASAYLQDKKESAVVLLLIGIAGFIIKSVFPAAPTFVGALPAYCLFASAFYAYYSGSTARFPILGIVAVALITNTVREGMFGDLFLWAMLMTLFFTAGMRRVLTARLKIVFVCIAFLVLLIIQSIKGEYRQHTWGYQRSERSSDASLMGELLADRLANPDKLVNLPHLFASFVRFNQGIMIGSAMDKVPAHESYANGEVLLSFLYPFVPRFLWADKPQTGGYENIRRFTSLPQSENTSINLSPIGEGYVNFGYGGIAFALAYGLLLAGVFQWLIRLSVQTPSVIFWIPALYIGCLTMETDILSTWGSMVNCGLFVTLLYWLLKRINLVL